MSNSTVYHIHTIICFHKQILIYVYNSYVVNNAVDKQAVPPGHAVKKPLTNSWQQPGTYIIDKIKLIF